MWNVTDSKKPIADLIIQGQVLDMTVQRNVPRFCIGSSCGWNLFQPLGLPEPAVVTPWRHGMNHRCVTSHSHEAAKYERVDHVNGGFVAIFPSGRVFVFEWQTASVLKETTLFIY